MGFRRGALLGLLGIPLPIILLLAVFWRCDIGSPPEAWHTEEAPASAGASSCYA